MPWVEVFALFVVSHLAGDYILQTEFQATHKHGGLGRNRTARRALLAHVVTYTLAFVPALVWLAGDTGAGALAATVAAIALPHGAQDDGRALAWWMHSVKHTRVEPGVLAMAVDQSFHMIALLLVAVVVGS